MKTRTMALIGKSFVAAVSICLAVPFFSAFADSPRVIVGGEVFMTNVASDVTLDGNWIVAGTIQKTGAGTLILPSEKILFAEGGRIDVLEGRLVVQKTEGAAETFETPTAILNRAGFWVKADTNVVMDGTNVTEWLDCREDPAVAARRYIFAQSKTNVSFDVSRPDIPPSWPTTGTDDANHPYVFFGKVGSGQWMNWRTPDGAKSAWIPCCNVFLAYNPLDSHGHILGAITNQPIEGVNHDMFFAVSGGGASDTLFCTIRSATPDIYGVLRTGRVFVNGVRKQPVARIVKNALQLIETEGSGFALPYAESFFNFRCYQQKAGHYGNGDRVGGSRLHEALVYTNCLTETERLLVETHLLRKWDLAALRAPAEINVARGAQITVPGEFFGQAKLRLDGESVVSGGVLDLTQSVGVFEKASGMVTLADGAAVSNRIQMAVKTESGKTYDVSAWDVVSARAGDAGKVTKVGEGLLSLTAVPSGASLAVNGGTVAVNPPTTGATVPEAVGNLIADGGFEIDVSGNMLAAEDKVGAWTSEAVAANSVRVYKYGDWGYIAPIQEGTHMLLLKNQGGIRQEITVPKAGRYLVSLLIGARTDGYDGALAIKIDDDYIAWQPTRYEGKDRRIWRRYRVVTPYLTAGEHVFRFVNEYAVDTSSSIDDVSMTWFDDVRTANIPNANFEVVNWGNMTPRDPWPTEFYGQYVAGWTINDNNKVRLARHATEYEGVGGNKAALWSPYGMYNFLLKSGAEMTTSFTVPETGTYRFSALLCRQGESGAEEADVTTIPLKITVNGVTEELNVPESNWSFDRIAAKSTFDLQEGATVTLALSLDTPSTAQEGRYNFRVAMDDVRFELQKGGNLLLNPSFTEGPKAGFTTNHWDGFISLSSTGTARDMVLGRSAFNDQYYGDTEIDGPERFRVHGTDGYVRQTVTLPEAGLYRFSFWARSRCEYHRAISFGPSDLDVTLRFGGQDEQILGHVEISRTCTDFRRYEFLFRAESAGPCTVGVKGTTGGDNSTFVDAFTLERVGDAPDGWTPFEKTSEVSVAQNAGLRLDYEGEFRVKSFRYLGRSLSQTIDVLTHPEVVGGIGRLYVEPKGTIVLVR